MFKKTLVAAALSTAAMSASAYEIGQNNDFSVEVYGVAAISAVDYGKANLKDGKKVGIVLENESRIGFRAGKEMVPNLEAFMQIEGGYVDSWQGGTLGARDTFVGLKGDWGKVRFGRMLTPMYEIVDWPYSNPGLGRVFDWGGDVSFNYDRQSNTVRYDSPSLGGLTFSLAAGRDGSPSGDATPDSYYGGASAHYTIADMVTLHGGVESAKDFRGVKDADTFGYIVGFEAALPAGFGLAGAYKYGENDNHAASGLKGKQGSYSIIGQYWAGSLGFKVGYAANEEYKLDGAKVKDSDDNVLSGQVMYVVNGFVPYLRVAQRDLDGSSTKGTVVRVGLEYGF
ncbi:porin [Motilimonas sp. KMU-193]|uniref:porin n=1 Tax=Motilimonas sp. KMU-193 TaxID=3388668 RepID=UPI00396B23FD